MNNLFKSLSLLEKLKISLRFYISFTIICVVVRLSRNIHHVLVVLVVNDKFHDHLSVNTQQSSSSSSTTTSANLFSFSNRIYHTKNTKKLFLKSLLQCQCQCLCLSMCIYGVVGGKERNNASVRWGHEKKEERREDD